MNTSGNKEACGVGQQWDQRKVSKLGSLWSPPQWITRQSQEITRRLCHSSSSGVLSLARSTVSSSVSKIKIDKVAIGIPALDSFFFFSRCPWSTSWKLSVCSGCYVCSRKWTATRSTARWCWRCSCPCSPCWPTGWPASGTSLARWRWRQTPTTGILVSKGILCHVTYLQVQDD